MVDYTERARPEAETDARKRARALWAELQQRLSEPDDGSDRIEPWAIIEGALSAVASEHQAALELAEAKVVKLSETAGEDYSVGFEAGAKAILARLLEPEMREAAAKAIYDTDPIGVRPWEDAPMSNREDCLACADAALAVITEKLNG